MKRYIVDIIKIGNVMDIENILYACFYAGNKRGARTQALAKYPDFYILDIWQWKEKK